MAGIYATIPCYLPQGPPPTPNHQSHASVTIRWIQTVWGADRVQRCLTIALPVAACRFRSGERHGQSSRLRLGGEAEPPLEKLQVDHRPGAKEGIPQTVSLRWAHFQHARKCAAAAAAAAARERARERGSERAGSRPPLEAPVWPCCRGVAQHLDPVSGAARFNQTVQPFLPPPPPSPVKLFCNKFSPCGVVVRLTLPPLLSYRTPGYRQWRWFETRGSVVSGLSIKRRICRCPSLRYLVEHKDGARRCCQKL